MFFSDLRNCCYANCDLDVPLIFMIFLQLLFFIPYKEINLFIFGSLMCVTSLTANFEAGRETLTNFQLSHFHCAAGLLLRF